MKKTIDYETAEFSIYKIVCLSNPTITIPFVGATTNFVKMKTTHKQRANNVNNKYHTFIYDIINTNGGFNNFNLIELERRKFDNKMIVDLHCYELLKRS